jgi:hypothetical protein
MGFSQPAEDRVVRYTKSVLTPFLRYCGKGFLLLQRNSSTDGGEYICQVKRF